MNIEYKIVKAADVNQILSLYRLAGWWGMEDNADDERLIKGIVNNSFCFVTAVHDGQIIGIGRCISDGVSDAYIQDVTVNPQYRGKGIGKAIIRTLLSYIKEHNLQWIGLISEPGYESFYQNLGFEVMPKYTPFLYKG